MEKQPGPEGTRKIVDKEWKQKQPPNSLEKKRLAVSLKERKRGENERKEGGRKGKRERKKKMQ